MFAAPPTPEEVIAGVGNALGGFICKYIPSVATDLTGMFDSPAAYDGGNENRLLLYLYQIELNPELRNEPDMLSPVQSGPSFSSLTLTPAPLAVDLQYMVVAYGKSCHYEQMIGASVTSLLDRCGSIPDEFIGRTLSDSGNGVLNVVPQPATIHVLRDLWAWFPNKAYHLTKLYTISPVRLPAPNSEQVDMVVGIESHLTVADPPQVVS